jgi:hypothetical protein
MNQRQQTLQRERADTWSSDPSDEEYNTGPALQLPRRHTDTFLSGDCKLTNRLNLLRVSVSPKPSSPTRSGSSIRNYIQRTGRHSIGHHEAMNLPLLSEGKSSMKAKSNFDENLENYFAKNSKKIRKRRGSVGSVGNDDDTYKTGAWTIKTDGLRLGGGRGSTDRRGSVGRRGSIGRSRIDKDKTQNVQVMPVPVYVKPLKSCLKPQPPLASILTPQPPPALPRKSCLKPPKSGTTTYTGADDSATKTYKESKTKRTKATKPSRRLGVVPEGYAAQLNVHTGQVEHLCVTTKKKKLNIAAQEKSAPELTMCTQLCIPKSATSLNSPRSFYELNVCFVSLPVLMSNSAA